MGLFSSLNKGKRFDFELPEALPKENYRKLADLSEDRVYVVKSLYLNRKSKHGDHYVALVEADDGNILGVNLPKYANEIIVGVLNNDEMVAAINAGSCGLTKGELRHGVKGDYYTIEWIDIE